MNILKTTRKTTKKLTKRLTAAILVAIMVVVVFPVLSPETTTVFASSNDPIVVVLDPGHGGNDPGAINSALGTNEARSNWAIAVACKKELERYQNVVVHFSRAENETIKLVPRAERAHAYGADLFVSLHNNSAGTAISSVRGCEVYRSVVDPFATNTHQLSSDIVSNLVALGIPMRGTGVKVRPSTDPAYPDDDYYTIIASGIEFGIPTILIEHAFVSNFQDAQFINDPNSLNSMGKADATAIAKYFGLKLKGAGNTKIPSLETTLYMQDYGWIATTPGGAETGFTKYRPGDHRDKRIEAFKINVNNEGIAGDVVYQAYVKYTGWTKQVSGGVMAGTNGKSLPIEGIKVSLTGDLANKYDIYYRIYNARDGWMGWTLNGANAGRLGENVQARAMQIKLVKKGAAAPGTTTNSTAGTEKTVVETPKDAKIVYSTHVEDYGWKLGESYDGLVSGTTGEGKRLENIIIKNNTKIKGDIVYSVHVEDYGWMSDISNGQEAGTTGESKRLEAITIKLTGDLEKTYDVYYSVHAQDYGWLDWAKNGEQAGTAALSKRLEGIKIVLVEKGGKAPGETKRPFVSPMVTYKTHVQDYGWQASVQDGAVSGTTGKSKRLEGIQIFNNTAFNGNINYSVHVEDYGWMSEVSNGAMAGTTGESKRLEAIQINLTGELAEKYDVYYRVHAQDYGWLGWAKNGEYSGTAGYSKRLEGIQIKYVKKGGKAPGETTNSYISKY